MRLYNTVLDILPALLVILHYANSSLDNDISIIEAKPSNEKGRNATMDPVTAHPKCFLCIAKTPPTIASIPTIAIKNAITMITIEIFGAKPKPWLTGTKILATNKPRRPNILKLPDIIVRIPAIVGITVFFLTSTMY